MIKTRKYWDFIQIRTNPVSRVATTACGLPTMVQTGYISAQTGYKDVPTGHIGVQTGYNGMHKRIVVCNVNGNSGHIL